MSTAIPFDATADRAGHRAPAVSDVGATAARAGAWVVLLGTAISTVGLSWDIQWHKEVGPDTFFTLPHLFLYSGSAISGFASLAMVVLTTAAQRADRALPRAGGTPIRVFGGTLTAPVGYMVSGAGAALFLLYGLLDLQWHSIYGFDAVLNTPSHVALFLSISITMIGAVMIFASHRDERWGQLGVVLSVPLLMAFAPIPVNALSNLPMPVDPVILGVVLFAPMLLILGRLVLARAGAAIAIAAALGAMQAVLWWFSPWAAHAYAASTGLPLRDGLPPSPPDFPGAMPMFLSVAAAAVEGLLLLRRVGPMTRLLLTGVVAAVIVGASLPLQLFLTDPTSSATTGQFVLLAILGIPLGLLAGFLADRFATMLRTLAQEEIR